MSGYFKEFIIRIPGIKVDRQIISLIKPITNLGKKVGLYDFFAFPGGYIENSIEKI